MKQFQPVGLKKLKDLICGFLLYTENSNNAMKTANPRIDSSVARYARILYRAVQGFYTQVLTVVRQPSQGCKIISEY